MYMCFDIYNPVEISIKDLHSRAKVCRLKERRDLNLLCILYEMKQLHLYERVGDCSTRQGDKYEFKMDIAVVGPYARSPYYLGSKLWNSLPIHIQNATTKAQFKHEVKMLWA